MSNGITGLDQMDALMRKIEAMGKSIDEKTTDKALEEGAKILKEKVESHPNMPRSNKQKEHAQDNIVYAKVKDGQYDVGASEDFFYLYFHEIGTKGGKYKIGDKTYTTPAIPATPIMRPSFENAQEEIQQAMGKVVKKELGL